MMTEDERRKLASEMVDKIGELASDYHQATGAKVVYSIQINHEDCIDYFNGISFGLFAMPIQNASK